jgi:hypothetical protein
MTHCYQSTGLKGVCGQHQMPPALVRLVSHLSAARGDGSRSAGMCRHCSLVKLPITLVLPLSGQASLRQSVIFKFVNCVKYCSPCRQGMLHEDASLDILCGALCAAVDVAILG